MAGGTLKFKSPKSPKSPMDTKDTPTTIKPPEKTPAEAAFEKAQQARLAEQAALAAQKSHKDKVAEYNAHLAKLSEHHDIPKVGPG